MKRATSVIPAGERANRAVMLPSGLLLQPVASDSCYLSEPGTPIIGAGAAGSVHRYAASCAYIDELHSIAS